MAGRALIAVAITSVALAAAAGARAEQVVKAPNPTGVTARDANAPDLNQWGPNFGRRSLQWDSKKARWGLKLDLDQPVGRPLSFKDRDIQAGAFYKITPAFRVGGSVSLGAMNETTPQNLIPADKAPKVRLETAFKF
jgi:hypothetical protein